MMEVVRLNDKKVKNNKNRPPTQRIIELEEEVKCIKESIASLERKVALLESDLITSIFIAYNNQLSLERKVALLESDIDNMEKSGYNLIIK